MYGSKKGHMGPVEEQEAIGEVASRVLEHMPDGWRSATYQVRFMGFYANERFEIESEEGETRRSSLPPEFALMPMKLRSGMYRENQGTWFSWKLEVWSDGRYKSRFNYDEHPLLAFAPDPDEYFNEMRKFPRGEEFTPG